MGCLKLSYYQTYSNRKVLYSDCVLEPKTAQMWLSVDPMSDKYPSMSPYNYCANNPIMMVDPDGRKIMGTDSNPINYTKNNDGTIKWTSNTSADVKLLGSIMLKTKVGTFFFDAMKNAKHDITIKIDNTEKTDKTKLGETENSYSQSLNGEDILNPNKIFESKITIFQNTIENKLNSPDGNKGGFSIAVAMAAVLVHEAVHATDFSNMIASLKYDLFKHADMYDFWYNNKEYEPERQRYLFLKEYNNLNK